MAAVYDNNLQLTTALLTEGVHPDFLYVDTTPLHEALRHGNLALVKTLVDAGADVNRRSLQDSHDFPLQMAESIGDAEILQYLEHKGARSALDPLVSLRQRALFDAVVENDAEKVAEMLKTGIDPDFMVEGEVTPLDEAITRQNESIVRALVAAGADVNRVNSQQVAPLDVAENTNDDEIINFLQSEGAIGGLAKIPEAAAKPVFREDTIADIFAAKNWAGRTKEMEELWQGVPKRLKDSFDFAGALADARQQTLKQKAGKFSLSPRKPPSY